MSHRIPSFVCLALLSLLFACGEEAPPPVGSVVLEPSSFDLPHGHWAGAVLRWQMRAQLEGLEGDPMVFVHLLDGEGNVRLTLDHALPGGWAAGSTIEDPLTFYHSSLGPRLPAGDYRLTVGLFDPVSGKRYALEGGPDIHRQEYALGTVSVPEAAGDLPEASFSPAWQPVEPGRDRQVLARRWLVGSGTIEFAPAAEDGRLSLLFKVPHVVDGIQLAFDSPEESKGSPEVSITSSCGPEARLVGSGNHRLEIPLTTGQACELELVPNYQLIDLASFRRSTLTLEQLAWQPGS